MTTHIDTALCKRIDELRQETFELLEQLRAHGLSGDAGAEMAVAVSRMQSVANQLGVVEALVGRFEAAA